MNTLDMININREYDRLQLIYGDPTLHSVYGGGCCKNPKVMLVFMNPTKRNIASCKSWEGIRAFGIGTKNVWNLIYTLGFIDKEVYDLIKVKKGRDWSAEFARLVYENVRKNEVYITNLAKCTQSDARALNDAVFKNYLELFCQEISLVNPQKIILFGNQVSSIFLEKSISVSKNRKVLHKKVINNKEYDCYAVYYPVGNGFFNIDKAIEDIKYILIN